MMHSSKCVKSVMSMKFSVLMSVYIKEQPNFLMAALNSLVCQTLPASQVVIVEDGPISAALTDVIDSYRGLLPIESIKIEENGGLANALNKGLKACTYDIVARMDTDDIALPSRFFTQIRFMESHPEISVCSAYLEERCDDMQTTGFVKRLPLTNNELYSFAKFRSPLSHPVVMFRKSAVLAVGGYPQIYPEDYPLWCTLLCAGYQLANIPEVLLHMRAGDAMLSRRGRAFLKGYIQTYRLMHTLGMITYPRLIANIAMQSLIRYSPTWLLKGLYRYGRR